MHVHPLFPLELSSVLRSVLPEQEKQLALKEAMNSKVVTTLFQQWASVNRSVISKSLILRKIEDMAEKKDLPKVENFQKPEEGLLKRIFLFRSVFFWTSTQEINPPQEVEPDKDIYNLLNLPLTQWDLESINNSQGI